MIKPTLVFRTNDGQTFAERELAEKHVLTLIENRIGPSIESTKLGIQAQLAVMHALVPNLAAAIKLVEDLQAIIANHEDDDHDPLDD